MARQLDVCWKQHFRRKFLSAESNTRNERLDTESVPPRRGEGIDKQPPTATLQRRLPLIAAARSRTAVERPSVGGNSQQAEGPDYSSGKKGGLDACLSVANMSSSLFRLRPNQHQQYLVSSWHQKRHFTTNLARYPSRRVATSACGGSVTVTASEGSVAGGCSFAPSGG